MDARMGGRSASKASEPVFVLRRQENALLSPTGGDGMTLFGKTVKALQNVPH